MIPNLSRSRGHVRSIRAADWRARCLRTPCRCATRYAQRQQDAGLLRPVLAKLHRQKTFQQLSAAVGWGPATSTSFVREPVLPGTRLAFPSSAVIMGDVPEGASIEASSDVVILGVLRGSVTLVSPAGATTPPSCTVLGLGPSAAITIDGHAAQGIPDGGWSAAAPGGSLAVAWDPRQQQVLVKALPLGSSLAPLAGASAAAAAAAPKQLLGQAAAAGVLLLGLALAVAPTAVFGGLLSGTGAESIAACLLEVAVYGYLLLQGAGQLGDGSELLLEVLDPGVIGGVVLPVLGALPDALIVANSGLGMDRAAAQEQLAVGIGTLAGSTILLLSLTWGGSVLLGRCDIGPNGTAQDKKLTLGAPLGSTGVTVDDDVRRGAQVMAASGLLYGIIQIPAFMGFSEAPLAALTGCIACLGAMVLYCGYSVVFPQLQQRRIEAARKKRFRLYAVQALARRSAQQRYGSLVDQTGQVNPTVMRSIFDEFDHDGNGSIEIGELQGLLLGLQLGSVSMDGSQGQAHGQVDKETLDYWFKEFDVDQDQNITYEEFSRALSRWIQEKLAVAGVEGGASWSSLVDPAAGGAAAALLADLPPAELAQLKATAQALEAEPLDEAADDLAGEEEGMVEAPLSRQDIVIKAVLQLSAGVAICALFSDPLVEALSQLSKLTGIPAFLVGFVLTPLASNSSEVLSSLRFAAKKRRKNMNLTLSQVYGAVTMNNTLVLGLFLGVVYLQRLEWVYSSEVTVTVLSTLLVGLLGASRSTFAASWAPPVMALYPLSLLGVFALDTLLGWQ